MKTQTVDMPTKVLSSGRRQNGSSSHLQSQSALPTTLVSKVVTHEEIAQRAYELWERDGCQHGNDMHYWHTAEQQLLHGR